MTFKILLAEDEPFLGKVVKESLEKKGYEVILANDGKKALEYFKQENFSICVLDVMMPFVDGFTLATQIRNIDNQIPILFLTAKSEIKDISEGYASGGNDYLKKPFSLDELFLRIAELLKRNHTINKLEEFFIGNYSFSAKKQEIRLGATSEKLSYKEAQVLLLLVQFKNQVLDRKMTLLKIWGDDNFFTTRNMDVYITKLRKKLSKDPNIQIVNIRGFGYKLIC